MKTGILLWLLLWQMKVVLPALRPSRDDSSGTEHTGTTTDKSAQTTECWLDRRSDYCLNYRMLGVVKSEHGYECQLEVMSVIGRLWLLPHKKWNNIMRSMNGNIRNCLDVLHWNAGARNWENKRDDIQHLIEDYGRPDMLFISEANRWDGLPEHCSQIVGYHAVFPKSQEIIGFSRILLLVKDGTNYSIEKSLMDDEDVSSNMGTGEGEGEKKSGTGRGVQGAHSAPQAGT